jgi:hypothetical protein
MSLLSRQPREGGAWDLKSVWLIADGLWFRTKRRRADRPSPSDGPADFSRSWVSDTFFFPPFSFTRRDAKGSVDK